MSPPHLTSSLVSSVYSHSYSMCLCINTNSTNVSMYTLNTCKYSTGITAGRSGEEWEGAERSGEEWGGMGMSGEEWGGVGKSG